MGKSADVTTDRERELKAVRLMDPENDALLLSTILAGFRQSVFQYKTLQAPFNAICS